MLETFWDMLWYFLFYFYFYIFLFLLFFSLFQPVATPLIRMIRKRLLCPQEAQKYRAAHLYMGPKEDAVFTSIENCDPEGPLCIYVAKLVPDPHGKFFWAFGRVLSGTVRANQKVTILGR